MLPIVFSDQGWQFGLNIQQWSAVWLVALFVINNVLRIGALFVVPPNRKPTSALAWLMVIFLLPIPGSILFAILGNKDLPKARRAKQAAVSSRVASVAKEEKAYLDLEEPVLTPEVSAAVVLGQSLGAQPMSSGNTGNITFDYDRSLEEMAAAIELAENYVHMEFYILQYDSATKPVFEAMRRAKERGVVVRVLLDHIASVMNPNAKETRKQLDRVATAWAYLLPVRPLKGQYQRPDLRNHRKLLVIDGKVGFMGSQNLVHTSYNKKGNLKKGLQWRDVIVRLTGPVVLGLEAVFQGDWYMETDEVLTELHKERLPEVSVDGELSCQILPSGPGYGDENNLQVFISLIYAAQNRVSITSPYFVPDEAIMNALRAATARGVEVELFVSETGDQGMVYHAQRSYYDELLRAGVRIFMFKSPYILHSKHFTIDDKVVVIGSSNMDERSFNLNMEVSMVVVGESFVQQMDQVTDTYRENSRELTREEWNSQPWQSRLLDNLARLTSALQ